MAGQLAVVFAMIIGIISAVDIPEGTPVAQGVGSPNLVLLPRNGRTSLTKPTQANNSISMFCGAKKATEDVNYQEIDKVRWAKFPSPDSTNVLEAKEVTEFESSGPASNNTVSLNMNNPPATAVGKYRCDLWKGSQFMATGNLMVYMRPVFVQEDNQRFDVTEKDPFELEGGGYTVTEGGDLTLSCRALGNPEPTYSWEKDGKRLTSGGKFSVNKHILNITGVTEAERTTYKCIATNVVNRETFRSTVTFNVRIQSKLAWLWPLLAIIITAILLAVIIIGCEIRRKKREREARGLEPEEED